jgi:hypothetical protein
MEALMIDIVAAFGSKKLERSADKVAALVRDSEIMVNAQFVETESELQQLSQIWIEFHGALANIPAIKNNRHPRFPGIDKTILCKLKAMDILFVRECQSQGLSSHMLNFGSDMVFVTLVTANTKRLSNEDNAMTTVKDWLEPRSKIVGGKKKAWRGWGIGLIHDDIQARGIALKSEDLGVHANHSRIVVQRWVNCSERVQQFVESF